MKTVRSILLILVVPAAIVVYSNRDFFVIDECLDAGGAWNDSTRTCIGDSIH